MKFIMVLVILLLFFSSHSDASDRSKINAESGQCNNKETEKEENTKQEVKKVITFDKAAIRKVLIEEGYSDEGEIERTFNELSIIDVSLQKVLDTYLADRTIVDDFQVEGLTVKIIMYKFRCDFWNALGFMNTSINNHQLAKDLYNMPPMTWKD